MFDALMMLLLVVAMVVAVGYIHTCGDLTESSDSGQDNAP